MNVLDLQRRLLALGYQPGPLDGIWGAGRSRPSSASRRRAASRSTASSGRSPGAALNAAEVPAGPGKDVPPQLKAGGAPVWFVEAKSWMGLKEIAGPASNPKILAWGKAGARSGILTTTFRGAARSSTRCSPRRFRTSR